MSAWYQSPTPAVLAVYIGQIEYKTDEFTLYNKHNIRRCTQNKNK